MTDAETMRALKHYEATVLPMRRGDDFSAEVRTLRQVIDGLQQDIRDLRGRLQDADDEANTAVWGLETKAAHWRQYALGWAIVAFAGWASLATFAWRMVW